jgi:flagellin-like protein
MYSGDSLDKNRWNVLNKNMLKTKKAISPILATLLLIVIAVAAIVVTYAWVMTYMSTTTQRAGEELVVENIRFHDSTNVTITLRSTGTSNSKIVAIYEGTSSTSLTALASGKVSPSLSKVISAGSSQDFNLNISTWTTGTRYYFRVVTDGGYALPFSEKA